jgi:signal transduction histidine kinase
MGGTENTVPSKSDSERGLLGRMDVADPERLLALGRMMSAVAHELGNSVNGVLGYADLLAAKTTDENLRRLTEKLQRNALNLRDLVESLRGFSETAVGQRERRGCGELVRQAATTVGCLAKTVGVEIEVGEESGLPPADVAPGDFRLSLFLAMEACLRSWASRRERRRATLKLQVAGSAEEVTVTLDAENLRAEGASRPTPVLRPVLGVRFAEPPSDGAWRWAWMLGASSIRGSL